MRILINPLLECSFVYDVGFCGQGAFALRLAVNKLPFIGPTILGLKLTIAAKRAVDEVTCIGIPIFKGDGSLAIHLATDQTSVVTDRPLSKVKTP